MFPKHMATTLLAPESETPQNSLPTLSSAESTNSPQRPYGLEDAVADALKTHPLNMDLLLTRVREIAQSRGMAAYSDSTLDLVLQRLIHLGKVRMRDFELALEKK